MDEMAIIKELTETTARAKSNTHQIEELKKRQDNVDKIVTAVSTLGAKYESLEGDIKETKAEVKEIKADVKTLADKPGKRWEALVEKAILVIVGALIGWLLKNLGVN